MDATLPTLDEIRAKLRALLPELRERFHVDELGVFGSYVRGEQTPESDLDLLVTFSKTPSLFKLAACENWLEDHFGIKVDLVMKTPLKPRIGARILSEVEAL